MAEDSGQEKTEEATPRRLREARDKGQVSKSKDVSTVFVFIIEFGILCMSMAFMANEFRQLFTLSFDILSQPEISVSSIMILSQTGLMVFAKVLAPMMVAAFVASYLIGLIQVGALFTTEPLTPKFEKLNPIEGIKNMFKVVTFVELIKNLIKLFIVLYFAYTSIYKSLDAVLSTYKVSLFNSAILTGGILFEFIAKVCGVFIFIALIDYAIQKWNFMKNMRMTKEEVKREYKQDEGDPAIKGERRRIHREMVFGDARQAVKKADAVVTNPTEVACVIEYNKDQMSAPTLTAKGQKDYAKMLIKLAKEYDKPIVRNIPLAWSLLHLELEQEIPEDLYEAVAEVLSMVYEMKNKTS